MHPLTRFAAFLSLALLASLVIAPGVARAAPRCFGRAATIVGTPGNDRLRGTAGPDVIVGLGGRDEILGRGGNDRICGGGGPDALAGQGGNDMISGGPGADLAAGGPGNDDVRGLAGADFLVGQAGDDRLAGGRSRQLEILAPGRGDDVVNGGPGAADLVTFFDAGQGVVVSLSVTVPQPTGQGLDRLVKVEGLEGSGFDDELTGNGIQTPSGNGLFGLDGDDTISGLAGVDFIAGEGGDDDLFGGEGDDFLDGGPELVEDTGDGGSTGETDGDVCVDIEVEINCESSGFAATASRSPASVWVRAAGSAARWWGTYLRNA